MARPRRPTDAASRPLKSVPDVLDRQRVMRVQQLKLRVQEADYVVDPAVVAEAILRHSISHMRCWYPRAVRSTAPAQSLTAGDPAITAPIQVTATDDSTSARLDAGAQKHSS